MVWVKGKRKKVSEKENADLFWGIRGGGGNFGIVTSFQFRLQPVGPQVLAGLIVHPFADAVPFEFGDNAHHLDGEFAHRIVVSRPSRVEMNLIPSPSSS